MRWGSQSRGDDMIELEDVEHNIFILRLIIRRKFGVEGESLDQAMRQMKRKLPKRTHKTADRLVDLHQRIGPEGTTNPEEIEEFEGLMSTACSARYTPMTIWATTTQRKYAFAR